jgi:general stress protein 26
VTTRSTTTLQEEPVESHLDERFSDPRAQAVPWERARRVLDDAQLAWITTVRPDGRPHVTPLVTVWLDERLHFCTGPDEQKARNLGTNPDVVLTTGCNTWGDGLDVVVEGEAVRVTDRATLGRLAARWATKWDGSWVYDVVDGGFAHGAMRTARSMCTPCAPPRCSRSARARSARRATAEG